MNKNKLKKLLKKIIKVLWNKFPILEINMLILINMQILKKNYMKLKKKPSKMKILTQQKKQIMKTCKIK